MKLWRVWSARTHAWGRQIPTSLMHPIMASHSCGARNDGTAAHDAGVRQGGSVDAKKGAVTTTAACFPDKAVQNSQPARTRSNERSRGAPRAGASKPWCGMGSQFAGQTQAGQRACHLQISFRSLFRARAAKALSYAKQGCAMTQKARVLRACAGGGSSTYDESWLARLPFLRLRAATIAIESQTRCTTPLPQGVRRVCEERRAVPPRAAQRAVPPRAAQRVFPLAPASHLEVGHMRLLREARQQLFLVQPAQRSLSSAVAGTRRRRRSPWHS